MEWITVEDLENISIGAMLLGTGGDPFVGRLKALQIKTRKLLQRKNSKRLRKY